MVFKWLDIFSSQLMYPSS